MDEIQWAIFSKKHGEITTNGDEATDIMGWNGASTGLWLFWMSFYDINVFRTRIQSHNKIWEKLEVHQENSDLWGLAREWIPMYPYTFGLEMAHVSTLSIFIIYIAYIYIYSIYIYIYIKIFHLPPKDISVLEASLWIEGRIPFTGPFFMVIISTSFTCPGHPYVFTVYIQDICRCESYAPWYFRDT
jgi:hypothetical protein